MNTPVEKLYTFIVTDSVLEQLGEIAAKYRKRFIDRRFKSLEILREARGLTVRGEIPY